MSREYAERDLDKHAVAPGVEGVGDVKQILLDEEGFWKPLTAVLKVATPIMVLLRLCDNQSKEVLGKVYYHMFNCYGNVKELKDEVPWAEEAAELVLERWDYLHGRMHAAAYALDPEFLYEGDGGSLGFHTMNGLMEVVERLSMRTIIQAALDPKAAAKALTLDSPCRSMRLWSWSNSLPFG